MNAAGNGLSHFYVACDAQQKGVIMDYTTGLMWQQGGSESDLDWNESQEYVTQLNRDRFAGYDDWRLPTLEEAMSLMALKKVNNNLYIDPVFDHEQRWIWTVDKESVVRGWYVTFSSGTCYPNAIGGDFYVRAVRSGN